MPHKINHFLLSSILTSASLFAVMLILGGAEDRSTAAQLIEDHSVPLIVQSATPYTIDLQLIDNGLNQPTHVANARDDTGRLFVVEQAGRIRVIKNGTLLGADFLDIHTRVESGGSEQGLLSVAFDPDYKTNGTFYVDYTTNAAGHDGDTVIVRYVISNPLSDVGQVISVTNLITIDQPEDNHNGGQLQFGVNDDYLYIGLGDGGGGDDQHGTIGNGQNLNTLLGKILRINVRGVPTYTIPASNPFTQTVGAKPEVWAYGLRNPWRFSLDRSSGDLYIGDVGQNCWEEIDYQPANSHGGENYGWRLMEGFHYFDHGSSGNCNRPVAPPGTLITLTRPITNYNHGQGDAVVGGYVYRGQQFPWLNGIYFYSDEGSGRIWDAQQTSPNVWAASQKLNTPYNISTFGEDQNGEVYAADYGGGAIYKIVSAMPADFSPTTKQASQAAPQPGETITYSIVLRNAGNFINNTIRVTDVIPIGLGYLNGSFTATRGTPDESGAPTLKWSGVMSNVSIVTLTYVVTVAAVDTQALTNNAVIDIGLGAPFTRSTTVIANGLRVYLPIILKNF